MKLSKVWFLGKLCGEGETTTNRQEGHWISLLYIIKNKHLSQTVWPQLSTLGQFSSALNFSEQIGHSMLNSYNL